MQPFDMVVYNNKVYWVHSFKMNREYVVLRPTNENDPDYETVHIRGLTNLGVSITDIPGCKTIDDMKEKYPEYFI